jgi:hypothetical protein
MNNLDHSSATLNNLRERFEADFRKKQPSYLITEIEFYLRRNSLNYDRYADYHVQSLWVFYYTAHISAVKQCAEIAKKYDRDFSECAAINIGIDILALLPNENSDE